MLRVAIVKAGFGAPYRIEQSVSGVHPLVREGPVTVCHMLQAECEMGKGVGMPALFVRRDGMAMYCPGDRECRCVLVFVVSALGHVRPAGRRLRSVVVTGLVADASKLMSRRAHGEGPSLEGACFVVWRCCCCAGPRQRTTSKVFTLLWVGVGAAFHVDRELPPARLSGLTDYKDH